MHSESVRQLVQEKLKAGARVVDVAKETGVSVPAIFLWRRQWQGRRRKVFRDSAPNDWTCPAPASEARFLLAIADRNGGRGAMRELIAVTAAQKGILERLAAQGQLSPLQVHRAIEFRGQVLEHFDRLAEREVRQIERLI